MNSNILMMTLTETEWKADFEALIPKVNDTVSEVRIDLKSFYNLTSEMIADLVRLRRHCEKLSISVILLNVSESVSALMDLTNVARLFKLERDFTTYTTEELLDMFLDPSLSDEVSNYFAANYDKYSAVIHKAMESEDSIIKECAILTAGRAHDQSSLELVRSNLNSKYPNVVKASLLVLGWLWDSDSEKRFFDFIVSEDTEIAEAAGASIALVCTFDDIGKLQVLSRSPKPRIRSVVAGVLSIINGDKAYEVIKEMFYNEKDPSVKRELVKRLSFFNKTEATEILISLLDDSSTAIQEAAAAGLERIGLRGHEDIVLKKVSSPDMWISYFAVKALGRQCSEESARYLMDYYKNAAENVKLAIIEVLGATPIDTTDFLRSKLHDPNEDVRKEALTALYKSDQKVALSDALELLTTDLSWLVRYRAVEIIAMEKPSGYIDLLRKVKQNDDNSYVQDKISLIIGE